MDASMNHPTEDTFEVPGFEYYSEKDPEAAVRELFDDLQTEFENDDILYIADVEAETARMDPEFLDGPQPDNFTVAMEDRVFQPAHYAQYEIEPITFIMKNGFDFWRGNIIKYASRAGSKLYEGMDAKESEITDLEKVRRYAEMRINQLRGEEVL